MISAATFKISINKKKKNLGWSSFQFYLYVSVLLPRLPAPHRQGGYDLHQFKELIAWKVYF